MIFAVHTTGVTSKPGRGSGGKLRPGLVLRLESGAGGGKRRGTAPDGHIHPRIRPHPCGKEAAINLGTALSGAAGHAPGCPVPGPGGKAA